MKTIEWNDRIGSREATAKLLLVDAMGTPHWFKGRSISGVCRAAEIGHKRDGKWSYTTYRLTVDDVCQHVAWHTTGGRAWPQATWDEAWAWLEPKTPRCSRSAWERVMRATAKTAAAEWDAASKADDGDLSGADVGELMGSLTNLTPHEVRVGGRIYSPTGTVARVEMTRTQVGTLNGVPLFRSIPGAVTGLPPACTPGYRIVSAMVRAACPDRIDLLSPADFQRDAAGRVAGAASFDTNM